jgi:hypothetical protein
MTTKAAISRAVNALGSGSGVGAVRAICSRSGPAACAGRQGERARAGRGRVMGA